MKNLRKIDPKLFDVFGLNLNGKIDCIAYVSDFSKARSFFGNEIVKELPFINAVALKTSSRKIFDTCKFNWVRSVTKQTSVMALMDVARKILIDENFAFYGNGITIAYIDTGIAPHSDFVLGKNRIVEFVDLISSKKLAYDDNGHGTFVAGAGSGSGALSNGKYAGIAPRSRIVSIKALNKNGEASAITILEAMQWVFENAKKFDIKVVCMSFGSEPLGVNDPIMKGAEVLWSKGIIVVAAAGNSGPEFETIKSPGTSPKILTVGGMDDARDAEGNFNPENFSIASFSSRGPALRRFKPDVVAPSVNIISCSNNLQKIYTTMSGTSVATPMVAGLCARLLEKEPKLSPDQVKFKIMSMSHAITFNKNLEGAGVPRLR